MRRVLKICNCFASGLLAWSILAEWNRWAVWGIAFAALILSNAVGYKAALESTASKE